MPWLMLVLAPGFANDPAKFDLAVMLARIALPYLLCMSLVALYSGMLNALGRFAVAALRAEPAQCRAHRRPARARRAWVSSNQVGAGMALAWGIAAAGSVAGSGRGGRGGERRMRLSFTRPRLTPRCARLIALAAPGFDCRRHGPAHVVLNTIIASLQDRVRVVALLCRPPVPASAGRDRGRHRRRALARPRAASCARAITRRRWTSENRSLEFALLLTLPAAVALFLASDPIVRVLFEHGAFTAVDGRATAQMLAVVRPGPPGLRADQGAASELFRPRGHQDADAASPAIAMGANLMLSLALFVLAGRRSASPLATTLAGWLHVALLTRDPAAARGVRARCHLPPPLRWASWARAFSWAAALWALMLAARSVVRACQLDHRAGRRAHAASSAAGSASMAYVRELFGAVTLKTLLASLKAPA